MSTKTATSIGRAAEDAAAKFLKSKGFTILAQNWRTRWCEIDIIAKKRHAVYFVEAKYRASLDWGNGLQYITPRKLQQMRFAAEFWIVQNQDYDDYHLGAIELTGEPPKVTAWLDDI